MGFIIEERKSAMGMDMNLLCQAFHENVYYVIDVRPFIISYMT